MCGDGAARMYASHKMWVDAVARDMASVDKSFTSQAVSAVAAHPTVVCACALVDDKGVNYIEVFDENSLSLTKPSTPLGAQTSSWC